ncbi:hypothetical protein [Tianweitania sediminis]|uniref:Uncharacterized protein n=1 Tax=Tianweitania sediminis TaxID=1502156 RepID=A0A8J7R3S9_9HYPH|nr:hypothetical protein [Tianweitania sediminis]MBP0441425.1 hypothetical protein [Tianweitania sediminis]
MDQTPLPDPAVAVARLAKEEYLANVDNNPWFSGYDPGPRADRIYHEALRAKRARLAHEPQRPPLQREVRRYAKEIGFRVIVNALGLRAGRAQRRRRGQS